MTTASSELYPSNPMCLTLRFDRHEPNAPEQLHPGRVTFGGRCGDREAKGYPGS
jgi:hypothetical protein